MPHSSVLDSPALTRPHTASSVPDQGSLSLSQGRRNRGRVKSQASIDAMFVSDVENRPGTAPNMDTRFEIGGVQDFDFEFESPSASPISKAQTKSKRRTESLAALLGDQILDAELKSPPSPTLELFDKKPRHEFHSKRVAFMDQKNEEFKLDLAKDNTETPLLSTSQRFPCLKREKRLVHQAPDKDDEWGATDVLTMLPDGTDTFSGEQSKDKTSGSINHLSAEVKPSADKADVDTSSDFGNYQPSFLCAPRRSPLAGRRRSPARGRTTETTETRSQPYPKTTYIKLSATPETIEIVPLSEDVADKTSEEVFQSRNLGKLTEMMVEGSLGLSRIPSIPTDTTCDKYLKSEMAVPEAPTNIPDLGGTMKPDIDRIPVRHDVRVPNVGSANRKESAAKIDTVSLHSARDRSVVPQPLEHQEEFNQRFLDNFTGKTSVDNTICAADLHSGSRNDLSSASNIQGIKYSVEAQNLAHVKKDEEEWSSRQRAFCDVLLAERNALQLKLEMERDKFSKEKEILQVRMSDEGLRSQGEIQLLTSAKQKTEAERDSLANEVRNLREENLRLKDEILRIENERLAFGRKKYEADQSHEDILLNKVEEEREEAQKLAIQLTSEVQLLKSSSLLAEEKIAYLHKLHEQEVQVIKSLHRQELEVKDRQFDTERKSWADHETSMDTVKKLLEKGDEWANKVDELHNILLSERKLTSSDKTVWLGTIKETVNKAQGALREWGDHCNGVKNQFDQLLAVLDSCGKEMRTMHLEERERLDKEHSHLKFLQGTLQEERSQSLADLTASRERLEEMRSQCFLEKENFLTNCIQELKDIAAEKETVVQMRDQLLQTEAALQKYIMEHTVTMQAEASEAATQRQELERAKEMAAEIVQEVEAARQELEQQRQAFDREIASVREFGLQAQQKVESAMEIQREALQLKLEADNIRQESAREASEIDRQKFQIAIAQKELLELKRRHDEERIRLAMERQQLCAERKENGISRVYRDPVASQEPVYSIYDSSKSRVLDLGHWEAMQKRKQARKVAAVPTRASYISSNTKGSLGSGPWVLESVEAQEDFLAEASKVLQHTTQNNCKLLTKT